MKKCKWFDGGLRGLGFVGVMALLLVACNSLSGQTGAQTDKPEAPPKPMGQAMVGMTLQELGLVLGPRAIDSAGNARYYCAGQQTASCDGCTQCSGLIWLPSNQLAMVSGNGNQARITRISSGYNKEIAAALWQDREIGTNAVAQALDGQLVPGLTMNQVHTLWPQAEFEKGVCDVPTLKCPVGDIFCRPGDTACQTTETHCEGVIKVRRPADTRPYYLYFGNVYGKPRLCSFHQRGF